MREQLRLARKAEALGYDSLWVTETRLARDAISVLGAMAATTERIRLGTGIVNTWTRGPALMAVTFATINVVGGYLVTDRMLAMFKKKEPAGKPGAKK